MFICFPYKTPDLSECQYNTLLPEVPNTTALLKLRPKARNKRPMGHIALHHNEQYVPGPRLLLP